MIKIKSEQELIVGKVYKCYDRYNREYKLSWSQNGLFDFRESKFIFLGNTHYSITFSIKGLVYGKILYAKRCTKDYFKFEELE